MRIPLRTPASLALLGFFLWSASQIWGQPTGSGPESSIRSGESGKTRKSQPGKKQTAGPFHGRLKAIDRAAGTIVMGTRTFHVSARTKITKDGRSATMADGVVGEMVSGYFKTAEDGKLVLSSLRFGPKPESSQTESGENRRKGYAGEK